MTCLNHKTELGLNAAGYSLVGGIDEAGRGAWAGPVVAACLVFDLDKIKQDKVLSNIINDSKKLTPKKRLECAQWLRKNFSHGVGVVASEVIDAIGIVPATKLAMKQAVENLPNQPHYLLIDAVSLKQEICLPQENVIKADEKIWSVAAASIIAKVTRDELMNYYHKIYGQYDFENHKGYGTGKHLASLKEYGICPIHRQSYRPVMEVISNR